MSRKIRRGSKNPFVQRIHKILQKYEKQHPKAKIEVDEESSVSIRIRIIDPDFHDKDRVERDNQIWLILEELPEEVQSNITMVLLLTPKETKTSFANLEFDHPVPSSL